MVHKFTIMGTRIVTDVESCAVHVLDEVAYAVLDAFNEETGAIDSEKMAELECALGKEQAREAADEIIAIVESGGLFVRETTSFDDGLAYGFGGNPLKGAAFADGGADAGEGVGEDDEINVGKDAVIKSLCLHMAHDCNMRCAYCFASDGSFGEKRALMSREIAERAVDFVIRESGARRNIEIDFFGGEPLLNFETVKHTVDYARSAGTKHGKNFRFTLTTNGALLDGDVAEYVNKNMDNLVLSADGRREVHDAVRKTRDGKGTYDLVMKKLLSVANQRADKDYYVRGTFTSKNLDFASDVESLSDLGFLHVSVEPVVAPSDPALELSPSDLDKILAEYERLAVMTQKSREGDGKPIDFFHFRIDLEQGPCRSRRLKGCGAGFEYAAVAPDGGLYPCHQFAGKTEFRMGSVKEGVINRDVLNRFRENSSVNKPSCSGCWAKYFCGGGCAANAWHYNKDLSKPNPFFCELQKKRLECAIWLLCAGATRA